VKQPVTPLLLLNVEAAQLQAASNSVQQAVVGKQNNTFQVWRCVSGWALPAYLPYPKLVQRSDIARLHIQSMVTCIWTRT
jgi:hypothetical protein